MKNLHIKKSVYRLIRNTYLLSLTWFFIFPEVAHGQGEENIRVVEAKGTGENKGEAMRQALRSAVIQAIGVHIDSNTKIENDELVQDEILQYTDGFVVEVEVLDESTNPLLGITIQIRAKVKIDKISTAYQKAQNDRVELDAVSLAAEGFTRFESKQQGVKILVNAIKGASQNLLIVRPELGKKKFIRAGGPNGPSHVIHIPFSVHFDQESYYQKFLPKFKKVLDQISVTRRSDTVSISFKKQQKETSWGSSNWVDTKSFYGSPILQPIKQRTGPGLFEVESLYSSPSGLDDSHFSMRVCIGRNQKGDGLLFQDWIIEKSPYFEILRKELLVQPIIKISFINAKGEVIRSIESRDMSDLVIPPDLTKIYKLDEYFTFSLGTRKQKSTENFTILPLCEVNTTGNQGFFAVGTLGVDVELTDEELNSLAEIKAEAM